MKGWGMPCEKRPGWTLVELLIVVIIIGILASLALPNYNKMREGTYDKEAIATLKMMAAALRVYRMELGIYINCTNTGDINDKLKLSLPTTGQAIWDTRVVNATVSEFTAQAKRKANDRRIWSINQTIEEPYNQSSDSGAWN